MRLESVGDTEHAVVLMTIYAIGEYRNNADLIDACASLGYINSRVLDCTYGYGRFWTKHTPSEIVGTDANAEKSPYGIAVDFRHMPFADSEFATVVFDPPYKLNGTAGSHSSDERYGVDETMRWEEKHEMIYAGITECVRVLEPKGHLLVKCQDQVVSGQVRWQTHLFAAHAEMIGCRLVDKLHLVGSRAQPPNRRQVHSRRNYSTLLVLKKTH